MAITNGTINRLNQLSSILSSVGNAVVDNMQAQSDMRINNASSLISTYYTNSNTGRVAETLNTSTRENLQENMQKLQKEIGELDVIGAKGRIAGLEGFKDSEVANALKTFKNNSGTYLATSYIQGMGALEQQFRTSTYNGITNYLNSKYSTYATDAQNNGDILHAEERFDEIFDNMTIDDLINSGYLTSDSREDTEAYLQAYKKEKKTTWQATATMYANEMSKAKIESDFANALNNTFTVGHASDTFYETSKTIDKDGNEVEEQLDTFGGANSYNKSKEIYDNLYASNGMGIADPNGVYKSGSRTGDIQLWTYASDAFLYNFGENSATHSEWVEGDIEGELRTWGEEFLLNCEGLTDDEKSIMLENWISSNIDTATGQIKVEGTVAAALAESAKDSMRKYAKFTEEVPTTTFKGKTAEDIMASMGEYGLDKNNSYDLQLMTNYMSAYWGFTVESTDLEYADELSTYKEELASIPHTSFSNYTYRSLTFDGETVGSQYGELILNMYDEYITANGITDTEEYKFGFFRAMSNAISSSTMELPKDKISSLKSASETMTAEEYTAYCKNLYFEGALPSFYAFNQALSYAPVTEYKEEQTKVEAKIGEELKKQIGDEGYDYFMKGIDMYPSLRRTIGEALNKYGGDWTSDEFQTWMQDYTGNMVNAYSADFNEKKFKQTMKEVMGVNDLTSSKTTDILGEDSRNVFYQWKQGNYDGIVQDSVIGSAVAQIISNPEVDYKTVRDAVYQGLYPDGEGFDKATDTEKSNVLLHMELATLNVEEQDRVEDSFGEYFGGASTVTPVQFEDAKQAYLVSAGEGTLVVWNSSIYDNDYNVGLLRPEISVDTFNKANSGRTLLTSDDISNWKNYKRTTKGKLDASFVAVGDKYDLNLEPGEYRTSATDDTVEWVQQNKYASIGDITQYLKANIDNIDDVATELMAQVDEIGFLAEKYNDPKRAIQVLVAKIKEDNGVTEPKKREYVTVGTDRGFFEVLDSIGYGKGNN